MFSRFRALDQYWDAFISVEMATLWRLHLVYGKKDGDELIRLFIQHFASHSTMLTLLISSQTAVFFSPSRPTEAARTALGQSRYQEIAFWAGLFLCLGIMCSFLALIATLSAWTIFAVASKRNAHVLLRSSLFLHAAALPSRLALASIYIFFLWINLFWYVVCALAIAIPLSVIFFLGSFHIVSTYSAVGRVIMYAGGISEKERILEKEKEADLTPSELTEALIHKALLAKEGGIPVKEQYEIKYQEQLHILEEGGTLQFDKLRLTESKDETNTEGDEKKEE